MAPVAWPQSPEHISPPSSVKTVPKQSDDIAGDWQGKLGPLRAVLRVVSNPAGGYCASFYSIDQGPDPIPVDDITLQNSRLRLAIGTIQATFKGSLQPGGTSISGVWKQPDGSGSLRFVRPGSANRWLSDSALHSESCITVAPKVQLEVLDWGGTGRSLVLLAGLGDTAHALDDFAQKLTSKYHVYGITRRGFGASSIPDPRIVGNYTAHRLGDDVLAVLAALKLNKPVLAGHSVAGEELSSISSHHSDRVAGFIYLEAGYGYAHYDPTLGDYDLDLNDLRRKLDELSPGTSPQTEQSILRQVEADLPRFQRDAREKQEMDAVLPGDEVHPAAASEPLPPSPASAIVLGEQKYTYLSGPILAIFAVPHRMPSDAPHTKSAAFLAFDTKRGTAIADSFKHGVPNAKVVQINNADHYIFQSNAADVLREMDSFIQELPK
jgi:non-heme chloroperoxidase